MKAHILLILLAAFFMLASCKKDEEDLRNSQMKLSADYNGVWTLNLCQNKLDIRGKIAPKIVSGNQIELKITSNADPIGFKITARLTEGEFSENKVTYLYKNLYETVSAGSFTDGSRKIIKVNPEGDYIKVMLGDNLLNGSFPINCQDVLQLTYWPYDHTATLFLKGYDYTGNEEPHVYVWTSRDPYPILVQLQYDNPFQYTAQPNFSSYNTDFIFVDGYSAFPNYLSVFFQNDLVFVDYNGTVYSSVLGINTFAPLVQTQYLSKTK